MNVLTKETAEQVLAAGEADAVAFGRPSSPIPTCPGASPKMLRSTLRVPRLSYGDGPGRLSRLSDAELTMYVAKNRDAT